MAFDDEGSRESESDLAFRHPVGVGVVVIEARIVIFGDLKSVLEGVAGIDADENIVAIFQWGNAETVEMNIGGLGATVIKLQFHGVAGVDTEGGGSVEAVVGVGFDLAPIEGNFGGLEDKCGAENALDAADFWWVGELGGWGFAFRQRFGGKGDKRKQGREENQEFEKGDRRGHGNLRARGFCEEYGKRKVASAGRRLGGRRRQKSVEERLFILKIRGRNRGED